MNKIRRIASYTTTKEIENTPSDELKALCEYIRDCFDVYSICSGCYILDKEVNILTMILLLKSQNIEDNTSCYSILVMATNSVKSNNMPLHKRYYITDMLSSMKTINEAALAYLSFKRKYRGECEHVAISDILCEILYGTMNSKIIELENAIKYIRDIKG